MRRILVGVMVAVVAGAVPAFGGMDGPPCDHTARTVQYDDVIVEHRHNAGAEFGLAVASTTLSVLYTPFRLVYGVVGAAVGGFGGWATGGDMRTAKGLWRPTTEGHYFIRPDYLDGTERFRFCGAVPPRRADYEVVTHERVVARDVAPPPLDAPPYPDDGTAPAL